MDMRPSGPTEEDFRKVSYTICTDTIEARIPGSDLLLYFDSAVQPRAFLDRRQMHLHVWNVVRLVPCGRKMIEKTDNLKTRFQPQVANVTSLRFTGIIPRRI